MDPGHRFGLILLFGLTLLGASYGLRMIYQDPGTWITVLTIIGAVVVAWGAFGLRHDFAALVRQRRGEIALFTLGIVGVMCAIGYLSLRYPLRYDMTEAGLHSLSDSTLQMLKRLAKPVHIVFFHDRMLKESVELYQLMASHSDLVTVEFHDPTVNPAQARLMGVQFAGTAVMQSEDRKLQVHGGTETDIANGILRVTQGAKQLVCFSDGHGEADPFSKESHDHTEGKGNHSHGLGAQYVLHQTHGLAKARHGLETVNYTVEKVTLLQGGDPLAGCALLIVAGPKTALLDHEIAIVRDYLLDGGNAFFMLDPFIQSGLEPIIRDYGVALQDTIVIDEKSHYWADRSSPAVTSYNIHQITRDLPLTFYPGVRSLAPTERIQGVSVVPLVSSSQDSFGETTEDRADFEPGRDVAGPQTLMVLATRKPVDPNSPAAVQLGPQSAEAAAGQQIIPAQADVRGESRIAVVGDSDFATNSFFHFLGNGNLFLNTVSYLAAQENLIGIEPRTYDLPGISVTNRQIKGTFFLSVFLMPAVLAILGTAVWWRQR